MNKMVRTFVVGGILMLTGFILLLGTSAARAEEGSGSNGSGNTTRMHHEEGQEHEDELRHQEDDDRDDGGNSGSNRPNGGNSGPGSVNSGSGNSTKPRPGDGETTRATGVKSGPLDKDRQQVCEQRKTAIRKHAAEISGKLTKHYERFTEIYLRVKEFVSTEGLTIADYETLTKAVDEAEAATQVAISNAQTTPEVDCAGERPREQAQAIREKYKAAKESLKQYRTTIKALVKAVKSSLPSDDATESKPEQETETSQEGAQQ
ncbi:hypothetical protein JNJ66_03650 [Candidatus Saccharibacteria bacterium]|nr:hypothetical protein [Candidatus Saccharibacteria bacterium]